MTATYLPSNLNCFAVTSNMDGGVGIALHANIILEELLSKLHKRQKQQEKSPPPRRRLHRKHHFRQCPQPPPSPSLNDRRDSSHTCRTSFLNSPPGFNRFERGRSLSISNYTCTNSSIISNAATPTRSIRSATTSIESTFSEQVRYYHSPPMHIFHTPYGN